LAFVCAKGVGKNETRGLLRRDTFGVISTPRKRKDIRPRVQVAERLLDTGMASLLLNDDVQTMERTSQVMITWVKTIMRELEYQLETEIAQRERYLEPARKLQGIDPIYNTNRPPEVY